MSLLGIKRQYELLNWLKTLLKILHDPPTLHDSIDPGKLDVVMTAGAQDGLYKICETLIEEGDTVFTEEPTYSSFMGVIRPHRCKLIPVDMDEKGLIPEKFSMVLRDQSSRNSGKLKFLYCVPNGGNPTGVRYTEDRKRKIYERAREYNLLIVEDDAYFFLETKVMLLAILKRMGHDGYLRHSEKLAEFYRRRRDLCIKVAEKHLNGFAEWHVPSGGMFLWIRVKDTKDSYKIVAEKLKARRIIMMPGVTFNTDESEPSAHIRVSYSSVSEEDMDKAFRALAEELGKLRTSKGII